MEKALKEPELAWLKENYDKMTQIQCAEHLKVTTNTLRKYAGILGLHKYDKTPKGKQTWYKPRPAPEPQLKPKKEKKVLKEWHFCRECIYYVANGHCSKNGKIVGALNEKDCFTDIEEY